VFRFVVALCSNVSDHRGLHRGSTANLSIAAVQRSAQIFRSSEYDPVRAKITVSSSSL